MNRSVMSKADRVALFKVKVTVRVTTTGGSMLVILKCQTLSATCDEPAWSVGKALGW